MSFILDALKKSESERQRNDTPSIASIPEKTQSKAPKQWVWVVAGLLAVNLVAVIALFAWKSPAVSETQVEEAEAAVAEPTFSEMVSEVKRNQSAATENFTVEEVTKPVSDPATGAAESIDVLQPGTINAGLESFNDLRARGELQLPEMHLDMHVYSGTPDDRFIFINMSKYKENTTLSEGPRVKEITPEGVILEHQNKVFLLPRQ